MRRIRLSLLFAVSLVLTFPLIAQKHPNIELGFNAERLYQFGELDSVNLLNGNLIVQIPIGGAYASNASFSYQLTLTYNSKVWDSISGYAPNGDHYMRTDPNWGSNAGIGWRLSLGRLYQPQHPGTYTSARTNWIYESAAGDEHVFVGEDDATVLTTGDQAHLRMVRTSTTLRKIEFPNGDVHTFVKERGRWRLRKMADRFGNYLLVNSIWRSPEEGSADGVETGWELQDSISQFRKHTITFVESESETPGVYVPDLAVDEGQLVKTIELAGIHDPLVYTFNYDAKVTYWGCGEERLPTEDDPLRLSPTVVLPFLRSITVPDQSTFAFTYYTHDNLGSGACDQATLQSVTVPTKAKTTYAYQKYVLPESFCLPGSWDLINPGVKTKTRSDGARWDYVHTVAAEYEMTTLEAQQAIAGCALTTGMPPVDIVTQPIRRWSRTSVLSPPVDYLVSDTTTQRRTRSDNYFYAWPNLEPAPVDPFANGAPFTFGEPATPGAPSEAASKQALCGGCPATSTDVDASDGLTGDRRYLSTRLFEGCANDNTGLCTSGRLLRSTSLRLAPTLALPGGVTVRGYGPESTRTTLHDDTGCSGACYVQTTFSDRDGAGNYERSSFTTNFPADPSNRRGEYTTYTDFHNLTTAAILNSATPWILGLYDRKERTENGVTSASEYCFDSSTGFLLGMRVLQGSVRGAHDVVTIFKTDGWGNPRVERTFGGDQQTVPTTSSCATSGTPAYFVSNTFLNGTRKSEYCDPAASVVSDLPSLDVTCASLLTTLDVSWDLASGKPTSSRDASGISTTYSYDDIGRLEKIVPPATGTLHYAYENATDTTNARATETLKSGTTTLSTTTYEFDAIGRILRLSKSKPLSGVSVVETDYDGMDRKKRVSQPFAASAAPTGNTLSGTNWTSTVTDAIGRPVRITAPDGAVTRFEYIGDRAVTRTNSVATSVSGSSDVSTKEYYDAQRRLVRVEENASETSADTPSGGLVTTRYGYDVAGRLIDVSMGDAISSQTRTFTYDQRGFLSSETHPERGTVTYGSYDAKGHAGTRTDDLRTLTMTFDNAERPLSISASGTTLKSFVYGAGAISTDLAGRLKVAVRRNDLPSAGQIEVTEQYEYSPSTGLLSNRKTSVEKVTGGTRTMLQSFTYAVDAYDKYGQPSQVTMPTCSQNGCSTTDGLATVSFARDNGFLTSVVNFANLAYSPSGAVESVTHHSSPEASDVYDTLYGLSRPSKITFNGGNTTCADPTASTITASNACAGAGTASVPQRSGITHTWTISGGTITSATAGESITFTAAGTGDVVLTARAMNACGAYTDSQATVATGAAPPASPVSASLSCGAGTASVPQRSGITHTWTISGGTITSSTTGESITFTPSVGITDVIVTVRATNSCGAYRETQVTATATTAPAPSTITAPSCVTSTGTATVPARTGISHTWSIQGGTLISGTTGETVTFQGNGASSIVLTVTATDSCGMSTASSVSVPYGCEGPTPSTINAPSSVCGLTSATASVTPRSGITHTWSIQNGAITSGKTGDTITFKGNNIGIVTLSVIAMNNNGSTSSNAQVSINTSPVAAVSGTTRIVRGQTTDIRVDLTPGTGPWNLTWEDGTQTPVTQTPAFWSVAPTQTTIYGLTSATAAGSPCSCVLHGSAQIIVVPPAPPWVKAERLPSGQIRVTWGAVSGVTSYQVARARIYDGIAENTQIVSAQILTENVSASATPVTYVYRVRARDSSGLLSDITMDYTTAATTLWANTAASDTPIRGQDIQELRAAVDAFRFAYRRSPLFSGSLAPSGWITANNVTALVNGFNEARGLLLPPFGYSPETPPVAPGSAVSSKHILQLRTALD
ncbi:MAG TPA: hypothetical protein VHW00_10960 [Thermoanaerobaculia bacterium]|nr:hypothetical protein [Thermoanaerobaculia bacterium]